MLVAYTEDGGEEQRRDRGCVCVICRTLLLASALLNSQAAASSPSSLSTHKTTATSTRARREGEGR